MSVHDYRINADVRRCLVSRWVDVSRLQIGTTNGVVYIIGVLDTIAANPGCEPEKGQVAGGQERAVRLAQLLDKELRRLPGVRDLVFKLENLHRKGRLWHAVHHEEVRRWEVEGSSPGPAEPLPAPPNIAGREST